MTNTYPTSLPESHRAYIERLVAWAESDARIVGVAAGGSYLTNAMDEYSDLDLVIAVESSAYAEVSAHRESIARSLGPLLGAFTGEHVGEPRLLICLYADPLLHVDLKFVTIDAVAERVEDPAVLMQRGDRLTTALARGVAKYPAPDLSWIDARFWVWVHYIATKIGRGELFDALDMLSFMRTQVLGPLGLARVGGRPNGVRRIEMLAPAFGLELRHTVAAYDAAACLRALHASVAVYRALRADEVHGTSEHPAEQAALSYLSLIDARIEQVAHGSAPDPRSR